MRTFTLKVVEDRLQGEMLAELKGQSFTPKSTWDALDSVSDRDVARPHPGFKGFA